MGAITVHYLRYYVAFGDRSQDTLHAHGHAYLSLLVPLVALLAGVALAHFLGAVVRARRTRRCEAPGPSFARIWLAVGAALSAVYTGQEWLEGLLAAGHEAGLAGVVGNGGWTAFVLAFVVAALIAILLTGARAVIALAARRRRRRHAPAPDVSWHRLPEAHHPLVGSVARHLAGRGPPLPGR